MTFEPRMRGSRFRRSAVKKQSAKEKREERETSVIYQEQAPIDPSQVATKILNALEHLGTQRFALAPFSEHFERWINDVRAIVAEMETELPDIADQAYRENSDRILTDVHLAMRKQIEAEKQNSEEISKLHQELTSCDLELSKLEHEYNTRAHDVRKVHERSLGKIKGEIDSLDKERQRLLRKRPSIVDRILHKPRTMLEESTRELETKKRDMGIRQTTLEQQLTNLRANYDVSRKKLIERQENLRAKIAELKANTQNDALELRSKACQDLRRVVAEAIGRLPQPKTAPDAGNIQ